MPCITESGRIIDDSKLIPLELVDGKWIPARSPLFCEELFNARILSDDELRAYVEKSGK